MNTELTQNVPRETYSIQSFVRLFENDKNIQYSLSLLKHRNSLILNTNNYPFILVWIKQLCANGYFPMVVFPTEREAEVFFSDALAFFSSDSIAWIPLFTKSTGIYENSALENHISRFLDDHYKNRLKLAVSSDAVFSHSVPNKRSLRDHMLHFSVDKDIAFSSLCDKLNNMGYQRGGMVEYCGEFAIRGGIVDIYAYGETYPFRVEFFGDTVESIRKFNPEDQNTFENIDNIQIRPASFSRYSHSKVSDILPDSCVVIKIESENNKDYKVKYDPGLNFKQVLFQTAAPEADVRFSISDIEVPQKGHVDQYYHDIVDKYEKIFVFSEHDIILESFKEKVGKNSKFIRKNIHCGFLYKDLNLILISGQQNYRKEHYVNPNRKFIPERSKKIANIESLEYGDYVVHVDYGIGIYRGIEILDFKNIKQESMIIEYKNKDRVYVPIRYMNKIFKYSSEKNKNISLDQIGAKRWKQAKSTTRNYLKKAAFDLLSLYQDRKKLKGFSFHKDTPDTLQLEASFPYDETPDQLKVISEINRDMENPNIMDRLVCGDVGFGKTEVAIRAAFKAVYSGKQVGILVPTTMLCFQHYESFNERLKNFGIEVSYVNRFVPAKQLRERLEALKAGKIDIIVGTHKLLSKDLLFNDLGLLIIDEEHRFGVNHKEKIQNIKRRLDVLTLTATPIPRTLQLSMVGLRDISKIDTPPKERLPISTKIMYWNDIDIQSAIKRELDRNGQVFILFNTIEEQPALRDKIENMFPGYGVKTAHGKMTGTQLESTLLDFYHHKFDILISTTIIESGIDIPNANTLIVMNAQNFGLSQLYQIRGRIGRSYKKAFAYLVIPRGKHINPIAMKRLQTLEYYTDLGSGYQIAMRDLEIRGAGSLFGVEQSGHINRVGYSYFNRMFSEEVDKLKNEKTIDKGVPDVILDQAAYLPEAYINSKDIRISFYRNISDILSSGKEYNKAMNELRHLRWSCKDRFGPLPLEAINLFNEAKLGLWLKTFEIESITRNNAYLIVNFKKDLTVDEIQNFAGQFLHDINSKNLKLEFISKKHLSAKVSIDLLKILFKEDF